MSIESDNPITRPIDTGNDENNTPLVNAVSLTHLVTLEAGNIVSDLDFGNQEVTDKLTLDIDGNNQVEPQDYNLIDLYASKLDVVEFGFLMENYPNDLIGDNTTRNDADSILAYFESIVPSIA